ncbi:tetratricopeptide repeat protein [Enterobacter hormaechei]|uniref:tetratricopeptide repeat protein n=1 Tax=Enterobacter hormaechei TaxID=158836 RepID=UPI00193D4F0B|nr:hypothetical protein [Enterobacter hormaechei]HCJ6269959.1 hypothetical protein [Enterobacter hormaechei subsp. xiangfangensis]HCJ6643163.1 hypothetical protein [Enterobacter hormaechei subsp. xiangfangensis]HCJ7336102.1 hypothetical protein [Enterobacter hormaechei subsp. xiangfangensis]HCR0853060.1 hypothetical protein [Enterobacter hormaechei]
MEDKLYNLIEVFIKYSLWPLLCILALIYYRKQLGAILSNLSGARNFKVQSPVLNIEATTTVQLENEDNAPPTENLPQNTKSTISNEIKTDWFATVWDLFDEGKFEDARHYFDETMKQQHHHLEYNKEYPFFLFVKYMFLPSNEVLNEFKSKINEINIFQNKRHYIDNYISCLTKTKQYSKGISFVKEELRAVHSPIEKAHLTLKLSQLYIDNFEATKAELIITSLIDKLETIEGDERDEYLSRCYNQLAEIEKGKDNLFNYALCLDKAAEYSPSDIDGIFSAAYEAANTPLRAIEIANYSQLINLDPKNSMTFNNMGVTTGKCGLKLISSEHFNKAVELDNTLAMANIGYALLNAGLSDQADEMIKRALSFKNPHENIHQLITKLNTERDNEKKKWSDLQKYAQENVGILRKFTRAYYNIFEKFPSHQNWRSDKGEIIEITQSETNKICIRWESNNDVEEIRGLLNNLAFNGTYTLKNKKTDTLLSLGLNENKTFQCVGYYDTKKECIIITSVSVTDKFKVVLNKS